MQEALLNALLEPSKTLAQYQAEANYTKVLAVAEELKTLPFGLVWDEYCQRCGAPVGMEWIADVDAYEADVLSHR